MSSSIKRKVFGHDIKKFKKHLEEDAATRRAPPESIALTLDIVSAAAAKSLFEHGTTASATNTRKEL